MRSSFPAWATVAIIVARVIYAAVFAMAMIFKFSGMHATAGYIAAAGIPAALPLAWVAAFFELALVLCFLTGAFFREACLAAAVYVVFLGIVFHGPSHWHADQNQFGFFVDHFVFLAGLLYAAVCGPGEVLAMSRTRIMAAGPE